MAFTSRKICWLCLGGTVKIDTMVLEDSPHAKPSVFHTMFHKKEAFWVGGPLRALQENKISQFIRGKKPYKHRNLVSASIIFICIMRTDGVVEIMRAPGEGDDRTEIRLGSECFSNSVSNKSKCLLWMHKPATAASCFSCTKRTNLDFLGIQSTLKTPPFSRV